jgi:hypothetical protein
MHLKLCGAPQAVYEDGYVYVKKTAPMNQGQFRRYLETCRKLGFRFDGGQAAGGAEGRLVEEFSFSAVLCALGRLPAAAAATPLRLPRPPPRRPRH